MITVKNDTGNRMIALCPFEEWLDWMLTDDILEKMMIHYDKEALDDMKSKATGTGWLLDGCLTDYSKLKGLVE